MNRLTVLFMWLWMCLTVLTCWANTEGTSVNGTTPTIDTSAVPSTPKSGDSGVTQITPIVGNQQNGFYSYDCNADTYAPNLSSFSTIWALLNVLVVIISSIVYLMYLCFNKFVDTMTKA